MKRKLAASTRGEPRTKGLPYSQPTKTTVPLPKYINQRKLSKIQMLNKEAKEIQIPIRTEGATPTHDRPIYSPLP